MGEGNGFTGLNPALHSPGPKDLTLLQEPCDLWSELETRVINFK